MRSPSTFLISRRSLYHPSITCTVTDIDSYYGDSALIAGRVHFDLGPVAGGLAGSPPALGTAIALLALRGPPPGRRFAIQLLGVQAAISAWQQFDYLFSPDGSVGGELHRSDTGAIADVLLLPCWFWGAIISGAILALLWWSFRLALRP
jgi:Peptidase M50B-like